MPDRVYSGYERPAGTCQQSLFPGFRNSVVIDEVVDTIVVTTRHQGRNNAMDAFHLTLKKLLASFALLLLASCGNNGNHVTSNEAEASAQGAITFLSDVMDQFHNRFPVYDDVGSAANHFVAYGKIYLTKAHRFP
jgi:hypothetical protein